MISVIYKYLLRYSPVQTIRMPENAQILSLQIQDGIPVLWALVDTEDSLVYRLFVLYATGQKIDSDFVYIGTIQVPETGFVFHCLEVKTL